MTAYRDFPGLVERLVFGAALLAVAALLLLTGWAWRLDALLYDTHYRFWQRPAPDDVVIVAIDLRSLEALGRWPWPRRRHAELIDKLTKAGAAVIVMDIIFAEPDPQDGSGDRALAEAIRHHGRVVMPVFMEQTRAGGQAVESLPFAPLAGSALLGHAHIELDPDGIARRLYLKEGLGQPRWDHLALAAARALAPERWKTLPGTRNPAPAGASPYVWARDYQVLLPFAGPPGHYPYLSYAQVLSGDFPTNAFAGKTVFVGTTATGMGDALPTPVSGLSQPMPGVEINANVFDALQRHLTIETLGRPGQLALTALLVLLPVLIFPRVSPRQSLLSAALLLAGTVVLSTLLLRYARLWFPPASAFIALLLAYPLWSWRRLELAMRFLNQELQRLHEEPGFASHMPDLDSAMAFINRLVPIEGWCLQQAGGRATATWGRALGPPCDTEPRRWCSHRPHEYWTRVIRDGTTWLLGVYRKVPEAPTAHESTLLVELVRPFAPPSPARPASAAEQVQARIQQVQHATQRLRGLRRFIAESLAAMADGVLVCNALGHVHLANARAAAYLEAGRPEALIDANLMEALHSLRGETPLDWASLVRQALLHNDMVRTNARNPSGQTLLVQLAPLSLSPGRVRGLIVNLSDITPLTDAQRKRAETLNFLSHDLRAPLVSLLALIERGREGERPAINLDRAEDYTRRTLTLADNFLQLSRAESSEPLRHDMVNLVTVAWQARDTVWDQARRRDISLVENYAVDEAWLAGDAELLERAVTNLLANAIQYSPPGSRVTLNIQQHDRLIECCVADTGPGIPADLQDHVFERYRRGDTRTEGTGLGLAFVKAVAQKHGGRVSLHSVPGKGARFCITLPAQTLPN